MSKERAKKLVKIYVNGRTVEKALKLDWESQAFLWDESEPVADTNASCGTKVSRLLTQMSELGHTL